MTEEQHATPHGRKSNEDTHLGIVLKLTARDSPETARTIPDAQQNNELWKRMAQAEAAGAAIKKKSKRRRI